MAIETSDFLFPRYAFIDGCEAKQELNTEFKYYDMQNKDALKTGIFPSLDCDKNWIFDEYDEEQWSSLETINRYFKCARLFSKQAQDVPCKTYLVNIFKPFSN